MKIFKLSSLFIISILFNSCLSQDWVQVGEGIAGDRYLNRVGINYDLNLQGNIIAITYSGRPKYVKVFELKNNQWNQIANTIISKQNDSSFGDNLSINETGDLILISESQKNGDSLRKGKIHILNKMDNSWVEQESIIGRKNDGCLGLSLKMDTLGKIVVTAQNSTEQIKGQFSYDEIVIFQRNGDSFEKLSETITLDVPNSIGKNVNFSNDGKTIAFSYSKSIDNKYYLLIDIYKLKDQSFEKTHTLKTESENNFGVVNLSLSSNGEYFLLGFPDYRTNEKTALGKVMIYKILGNQIEQVGAEITGENKYDYFGHKISINCNGNIISVGAPRSSTNKNGFVKTYKFKNNEWQQIGRVLKGSNPILNGAGNILAVGNYGSNNENGEIQIYEFK